MPSSGDHNYHKTYSSDDVLESICSPSKDAEDMLIDTNDQIDIDYEQEQAEHAYERMTSEQKLIYNYVKQLLYNYSSNVTPKCIFIDGPGGSGKSFVIKAIDHYMRSQSKLICNMSGTGVAANELRVGRTVHNRFGLEVPCDTNEAKSRRSE